MKNFIYFIFYLIIFFALPHDATANKQYFFQQIASKNGLPSTVRCLTVSSDKGYVWIGTKSGIGRFDGYELKKYLRGNITHIVEDKEHTIWAITEKGVFQYDYMEDEFIQSRDKDNNPVLAQSICLWADGVIFGGRGKLYKYTYNDHSINLSHILKPNNKYQISQLHKWDDQTLLCTSRWENSLFIDVHTGQTRPVPFDGNQLITTLIDSKGNVWVAPYNQGVRCYDSKGKLLHSYNTQNSSLRTDVILALAERNGQIWIGTDGAGIYVLDPELEKMSVIEHIPGDPNSLPVNSILCLYKDNNNNMWAGSVRSGLINIKEVGMKIYLDALPGKDYGLSDKIILSIYQDDNKNIWIGTDGGGINRFDPVTGKFHHILSTWGDKVASITGMDSDHLLVSLFSKGLFIFNKKTESYRPLTIVNDSINAFLCRRGKAVNVIQDSPESVLLLSDSPYSYNFRRKEFTPIQIGKGIQGIVGTLLPISLEHNSCYLYDMKRIYRLNYNLQRLETIYTCQEDTTFRSISQDGNGVFWIGSNYGLSSYDPKTKHHTNIQSSLISEVNSLICDGQRRVWIGTDGQLFAHLIDKGEFILYGEPDGIIQNEYLEKPRLLTQEGDIYLGGVNGLLHINKQLPTEPPLPPILALADVFVSGERVNDLITNDYSLTINEQSKPIIIKIIAHNKDIFRKPMYRYTLTGLDGQTIYSYLPELTLSSLPSGTYQVKVACSTRTGGWTENKTILSLVVLPPWYKSGWFVLCCSLLIFAGIALTFILLLRRKESKLKWAMKDHEQQVYEEKVRFLINISHELRTPLTLIHAPLRQLMESLSPHDLNYAKIQNICKQSGRMKNILNMVLDVRKMEVGQSTLNAENVDLNFWMEQLIADFKPEATMRGITLDYQPDTDVTTLCFDKDKGTTIITNLLINALKYSPEHSFITISIRLSDNKDQVRISISDQGPGLKDVDINNLFVRFYQGNNSRPGTGIGLSYAKILVEQHGGNIGAYDNGNVGATFWFEIPFYLQPGKITLRPQEYLNELLAPTQETETIPTEQEDRGETRNHTLLVVDDNKDLTDYLADALKDKFQKIWIAADGEEALRICLEKKPGVVVSDIQMPRMNGYELCKQIKENLEISHTPVILLTARNDQESQLYGYKNGADAYLTKPFEVNILYAVIRSQLNNRERMRTRYVENGSLPQPEESTFSSADEKFLSDLNKLINTNLDNEQMGVPFICTQMGISRSSLYNKLKALTDMGANDYITKLRIERAIWLIIHTELSVNEVADQTGFSTPRYFSTVFKQYTGYSPTLYKEKQNI